MHSATIPEVPDASNALRVNAAKAAQWYRKFAADRDLWNAEAARCRALAEKSAARKEGDRFHAATKHHADHLRALKDAEREARKWGGKCIEIALHVRTAEAYGRLIGEKDEINEVLSLTKHHTEGEIAMTKTQKTSKKSAPGTSARATRSTVNDPAVKSMIGSTLTREYKGKTITVRVTEKGFVWDGETYVSLNQIACKAQGRTGRSGDIFFHVGKYARTAKPKAEKKVKGTKAESASKSKSARNSTPKKTAKKRASKKAAKK